MLRLRPAAQGFRADVEGLRAVAIGAVLLAHAGVPLAAGGFAGVDVFFVISGFLITGMIVREAERAGAVSLLAFYARRMKRLLPLAVTVLAAVGVLSVLLLSPVRDDRISGDIVASGVYVLNWRLAAESVDYFADHAHASPVQHYWSLAVEEQFYLVWPLLLLVATWWARRRGTSLRPALWAAVVVVGVASMAYAVALTHDNPGGAYFSFPARAWELALGGGLALLLSAPATAAGGTPSERGEPVAPAARVLPPRVAAVLGWAGLAAIAFAVVTFDRDTRFPGPPALVPTLGTAAVVLAGGVSVGRVLERRPVRHVGRVSYALYLWHWPLLVLAEAVWGTLSVAGGLAVVVASWVPAVLSHRVIERPLHHSRRLARHPSRALRLGIALSALAVLVGCGVHAVQPSFATAPVSAVIGARAKGFQTSAKWVRPTPRHASQDKSRMHADGCLVPLRKTVSGPCVYGDTRSKTTVVLFGDSHAMQYFPALVRVARRRHWRLVGLTKGGCTPAQTYIYNNPMRRPYTECQRWRGPTLRRIADREHPAMVVTTGLSTYTAVRDGKRLGRAQSRLALRAGWIATLRRLKRAARRVVVLRDGPAVPFDAADCVSAHMHDLRRCSFRLAAHLDHHPIEVSAARAVGGVRVIDPTHQLCPHGRCPSVMGNALVYRDGRHMTATFARTLAPWLRRQLPALRRARR